METYLNIEDIVSVEEICIPITNDITVEHNSNYYLYCNGTKILVHNSSKTTSIIQILIQYCFINQGKRKKITAARAKYSWCKDSILKDFIDKLVEYGLYDEKCHVRTHPQSYKLYSNEISFIGLDDPQRFHGPRQDITWINEAMEADQDSYRQLEMRTNECMILDYNPSYTQHWIFDTILSNLAGKKNTFYFRSTFRDNPFLPKGQRDTILSYEPTPQNIKNGTADEYKWRVYGLGERAAQKGTIFKYVTWIDRFPENVDSWYAIDFGYTIDPTAIVRGGIDGDNLYLQKMLYEPIDNPDALAETLMNIGINKYDIIFADSADRYNDKEFIKDLRALGFNIKGISKTKGVVYWIGQLKKYKIHIVESVEFRIEQENYRWKEINGMQINQPIDKFNHLFDASRYLLMGSKSTRYRMW